MTPTPRNSHMHSPLTRRTFLAASTTGLCFANSLCESAALGARRIPDHRIVKVVLAGGPSQTDLWDPKPNAEVGVRGPFRTIQTSVPGIHLAETLPQIASMMRQFTVVRSVTGSVGSHHLQQVLTGSPIPQTPDLPPTVKQIDQSPFVRTFEEAQRRLDSGSSHVIVKFGNWDHHRNLKARLKCQAALLDEGLADFVRRLSLTGELASTIVLVWGEFGRTPKMNSFGGRDHWPAVNSALMTGGGAVRGNVWGATSADASEIIDAPIRMNDLMQRCESDQQALA